MCTLENVEGRQCFADSRIPCAGTGPCLEQGLIKRVLTPMLVMPPGILFYPTTHITTQINKFELVTFR